MFKVAKEKVKKGKSPTKKKATKAKPVKVTTKKVSAKPKASKPEIKSKKKNPVKKLIKKTSTMTPKTRDNLTLGIAGFLGFIVLSSKGILIYNEEILVALGFLGFVYFVSSSYGKDIKGSLDLRGEGLKEKVGSDLKNSKDAYKDAIELWAAQNPTWCLHKKKRSAQAAALDSRVSTSNSVLYWFSAPLLGSSKGLFKSSIASGTWGLLKGESMSSGDNIEAWSGSFRQRVFGKAFNAVGDGNQIHQEWIKSCLANVEKIRLS